MSQEVFYEKSRWYSWKFRNIHKKTSLLKSLLNKVPGRKPYKFVKKGLQHRCFPANIAKLFKNTYLEEHLRTAASEVTLGSDFLGLSFWTTAFKTILT